jgi:phenylalanyl-tRNA synthetase beta chain
MKVVLAWLREFCPTDLTAEELAEVLSLKGVHVENVLHPWEGLAGVVVARVLEVRDHPNSEKLCLARVSHGSGELELVVGVRNMKAGDLVPLAPPGARVPALPEPLAARSVRGVVSNGMVCSPRELAISGDHLRILVLPKDAPVGADLKAYLGLDDAVLDIEIEPNRPDLMSVFGVAREVAAATAVPLEEPDWSVPESGEKAEEATSVEVLDLERCPQYVARVIRGVDVGESPLRVQARLTAAGMRPLSSVVDATNYAMLAMGQPLHAFDLDLLAGRGVVVRRAAEDERLLTLDDVDRRLTPDDLVISDHEKAMAIAGIMGSAPAEVGAKTRDVLLESAYFQAKGIIMTSRRLALQTEASLRFGRGADPENTSRGAAMAARLMAEWAGGTVLAGEVRVGDLPDRRWISVRPSRASLVIGYQVTAADAEEAFGRLGIAARRAEEDLVEVEVPGHRVDLVREVDLIEEIVRVHGYHRLGSTHPAIRKVGGVPPTYALRRRTRAALARAGLREALSLSFASDADLDLTGDRPGVRLANPVSSEEPYLRASLLPGLLRAAGRNAAQGVRGVALFEVGHVFALGHPDVGPPAPVFEREFAAGVLSGAADAGYPSERRGYGFSDAKGAVESFMEAMAIASWDLAERASRPPLHPARGASVVVRGERVGMLGELHPRVIERLDLPAGVAVFELDLTALAERVDQPRGFREVPRFPPVRRDLAFLIDESVPVGLIRDGILRAAEGLADQVVLFDVFSGDPLPDGKKSVAFSLDFRAPDRTLTDEEAQDAVRKIVADLASSLGAELRTG